MCIRDRRKAITPALIGKLNDTNRILGPRVAIAQKQVAEEAKRRRRPGEPVYGGAPPIAGEPGEPGDDASSQPSW